MNKRLMILTVVAVTTLLFPKDILASQSSHSKGHKQAPSSVNQRPALATQAERPAPTKRETSSSVSQEATLDSSLPTLEALIAEATTKSADLAAMRQQIAAAEARITVAGALPDPMASAGFTNIPIGEGVQLDQDEMSGFEFMISREVPRSFRRRLRSDIQSKEVASLQARYTSLVNSIVREVKRVYFDLQYLDEAMVILEQNRLLAEDVVKASEAQYTTGKVSQQDIFQAQLQLSRMIESLVSLRKQRAAAATRLNRLLYRLPTEPMPKLLPLTRSTPSDVQISLGALQKSNSVLRESLTRIDQTERQVKLAEQWRRPDYSLSFRYMMREPIAMAEMSGTDMWSASIGINLPFLNRKVYEEELKAVKAEQSAAQQNVQSLLNEIPSRLEELMIDIQRIEEQLSLVETGLLPQAEGALASSRSDYVTGRTNVLNVLTNLLSLYNLQLERAQLLKDHEQSAAEFEYQASGALQSAAVPTVSAALFAIMAPSSGGAMQGVSSGQMSGGSSPGM